MLDMHITAIARVEGVEVIDSNCWRTSADGCEFFLIGVPRLLKSSVDPTGFRDWLVQTWTARDFSSFSALSGPWGLFIYNLHAGEVTLITDRLGAVPFYYRINGQSISISTRTSGSAEVNPSVGYKPALTQYMVLRHTSGDREVLEGVRRTLPGSGITLQLREGQPSPAVTTYYHFPPPVSEDDAPPDIQVVSALAADLEQELAGGGRFYADRWPGAPLGVLLSGGLDSSLLLKMLSDNPFSSVECVTFGFEGGIAADRVTAHDTFSAIAPRNARWSEYSLALVDVSPALDEVIRATGKPIDHPNFLGRFRAYQLLAARHARVVLAGEGADTLFGGTWYLSFQKLLRAHRYLPQAAWLRRPLLRLLGWVWPSRRQQLDLLGFGDPRTLCLTAKMYLPVRWLSELLGKSTLADLSRYPEHYQNILAHGPNRLLDATYKQGLTINMTHELISEQAMAFSQGMIQWNPYLDGPVAETACRVPFRDRTLGWNAKRHLRQLAADRLPPQILNRAKSGSPAPLITWLRSEGPLSAIVGRILEPGSFVSQLLGNDPLLVKTVAEFRQQPSPTLADVLWVLVNLQRWSELYNVRLPELAEEVDPGTEIGTK